MCGEGVMWWDSRGLAAAAVLTGEPLAVTTSSDRRARACAGVPAGSVDVVLSYCHYCLNDTSLEDHLQYLQDKQVGGCGGRGWMSE